ncbi:MAG: YdeI/OmpD-associated family protein [Ferruginibacter sp.]
MIVFKANLLKFGKQGEKTGWTYFTIPQKIAYKLKPGNKRSFRVKGRIDQFKIQKVALLPMGEGDFIMPVNAAMRKGTGKRSGDTIEAALEIDKTELKICPELIACMMDEPAASEYFKELPKSHQQYYSKWIESAKTDATKTKRIALAINAFSKKLSYAEMLRMNRDI